MMREWHDENFRARFIVKLRYTHDPIYLESLHDLTKNNIEMAGIGSECDDCFYPIAFCLDDILTISIYSDCEDYRVTPEESAAAFEDLKRYVEFLNNPKGGEYND